MALTIPCPVCGGRAAVPFGEAPPGGRPLHRTQQRCLGCGLVCAEPQATAAEMAAYYTGPYYAEGWPDADGQFTGNQALYARELWPRLTQLWAGYAPPAGGSVFEVGCGYGSMLALFRERGFRVQGVESSPRAAAYARERGLPVAEGLMGGEGERGAHDVAIAVFTIEHVPDPAAFLAALAELARPGGAVVIVTDAIWTTQARVERAWARLRGRPAPFRTSTDHTYVFEPAHLRTLFTRAGCTDVQVTAYSDAPPPESLHWKLYKGSCRTLDRWLGLGEYLVATGRRAA